MKFVHLFLVGVVVLAFNACEKQPYSKIESMTAEHGEAKAPEHEAKAVEKAEHEK